MFIYFLVDVDESDETKLKLYERSILEPKASQYITTTLTASEDPMITIAGVLVTQATREHLTSEDWAAYMDLCDLINKEGPQDVVKAIMRRLINCRQSAVLMHILSLLDSCLKNCGQNFHSVLIDSDILTEVMKTVERCTDISAATKDRLVTLIGTLTTEYKHHPIDWFIHQLSAKNIIPLEMVHSSATLSTPKSDTETGAQCVSIRAKKSGLELSRVHKPHTTRDQSPALKSPRIQKEVANMQQNIQLFSELSNGPLPDMEILQVIGKTCEQHKMRIDELLNLGVDEDTTQRLFELNDEVNILFERHSQFMKSVSQSNKDSESQVRLRSMAMDAGASEVIGAGLSRKVPGHKHSPHVQKSSR